MGNHDILDNNYTYMKSDKRVATKNTEKLLDEFDCP